MKTYNLAKEILVVSVPWGAYDIKIRQNSTECDLCYTEDLAVPNISNCIELPSTGYSILSTAKEMTEEKASQIMPKIILKDEPVYYQCFDSKTKGTTNALFAFRTWEISEGIFTVNPYGKEPIYPWQDKVMYEGIHEVYVGKLKQWQEAEAKLANTVIFYKEK